MRLLIALSLIMATSAPAFAQQITVEALCEQLSQRQIESAEYQPNVDVNGNPVAPADLNAIGQPIIYPLVVPIELHLLRFLDLDPPDAARDAIGLEPDVAFLSLFEDGRIEYNGQDISDSADFLCVSSDSSPQVPITEEPVNQPTPPAKAPEEPKIQSKPAEQAPKELEEQTKTDDTKPPEPVKSSAALNTKFKTLIDKVTTDESAPEEPKTE